MSGMLLAFIPKHVSERTVLRFFEFLRKTAIKRNKRTERNLRHNEDAITKYIEEIKNSGGFIEGQKSLTDLRYGRKSLDYCGCEIIALYNALVSLKAKGRESLPKLIAAFEKDGMVLSGKFGTSPRAIYDYLKKKGFDCTFFLGNRFDLKSLEEECDTYILTVFNDRNNIKKQVHTIAVSKDEDGFIAHNVYGNGVAQGPFANAEDMLGKINKGRSKIICAIGIKK